MRWKEIISEDTDQHIKIAKKQLVKSRQERLNDERREEIAKEKNQPILHKRKRKKMKRKDAKAQQLEKYFTGKPCRNGHLADRYTGSGDCVECKRMKNLANKEQTKLATRKYRENLKK